VLSSWQSHCESSLGSRDEYSNGARWPSTFGPSHRQPVNRIHHRHLLLLLSPKADTHFTVPRRVEGWVDLGSCYVPRWFTRLQTVTHPSTNRAWHRVTSLICPTTLPLRQTKVNFLLHKSYTATVFTQAIKKTSVSFHDIFNNAHWLLSILIQIYYMETKAYKSSKAVKVPTGLNLFL